MQAILRTAVRRTGDQVTAGHRTDAIQGETATTQVNMFKRRMKKKMIKRRRPPWRNLVRRTNEQTTKGHIPKALTKVKDIRVNTLTKVKDIRVNTLTKVTDTRVNTLTKVKDIRVNTLPKVKGTKGRTENPTKDTTSKPTLGRIPTEIEDILPPLLDLGVSA